MLNALARLGPLATTIALCIVLASTLADLHRGHDNLQKIAQQQAQRVKTDGKVQLQLESLAKGTQALASAGNPNAQRIVAVLKQNGVNIKGP